MRPESRSHVDPSARLGEGTQLGSFSVIGKNVQMGRDCQVGSGVVIHDGCIIGDRVRIDDHTVVGKQPMRSGRSALTTSRETGPASIGAGCLIGTSVVIYAGATLEARILVADLASIREEVDIGTETIVGRNVTVENRTRIGARCKLEANAYITAISEIGDDCFIAPEVTFTNDRFLGRTQERFRLHRGPVLERGARIGANATVLPGLRIGADALVAAGSVVTRDVRPRVVVAGSPAREKGPVRAEELLENQ